MNAFLQRFKSRDPLAHSIKNLFGFTPKNIALYRLAFRHKSVAQKLDKGIKNSNERLEFLGDAVLGCVVAEHLFSKYPYKDEGFLTEMRSRIVSRSTLNKIAGKMGLEKLIDYDKNSKYYKSLSGDTFEAMLGAIYLDKGFTFTKRFIIKRIIGQYLDIDSLEMAEANFKGKIIHWAQRQKHELRFECTETVAADKSKYYSCQLQIEDGTTLSEGKGFSKKAAEQMAAELACQALGI